MILANHMLLRLAENVTRRSTMQLHCMSDALIIAAALLTFIALWGVIVFLIGWKESSNSTHTKLRRFWIVVFAACGIALLLAVFLRTTVPGNTAVEEASQLALQSPQVQDLLGNPIRYSGFRFGGYQGIGEGSHVSAVLQFKGSKQAGTLHACAIKRNGRWQLTYAEMIAGNNVAVTLTNAGHQQCQP